MLTIHLYVVVLSAGVKKENNYSKQIITNSKMLLAQRIYFLKQMCLFMYADVLENSEKLVYFCTVKIPMYMNRKILLFVFFIITSHIFAQETEGYIFEVSARVKIHLPTTEVADLFSSSRFIQVGVEGSENDRVEMKNIIGNYFVKDEDITTDVVDAGAIGNVTFYKFYLIQTADANTFQGLFEYLKINSFIQNSQQYSMSEFSNKIYAWIKSQKTRN